MTPWHDRVFIVAEAGVNHNGDPEMARRLIDVAVAVGCDAVKFQSFRAGALAVPAAQKAEYQKSASGGEESQYAMLKQLELGFDEQQVLSEYARERDLCFFSTAFDLDSVSFLGRLDMPLWKIPSGEITNYPYLATIGAMKSSSLMPIDCT